jgi:N-acetylneuraminate synthase
MNTNQKVIVIAEAGVNHNGSLDLAKELVVKAAEAGADYVKFQTFNASKLVSKNADLAEYQKSNTNFDSQLAMLQSLEMGVDQLSVLEKVANKAGVQLLSSPFDIESATELVNFGMEILKIPSGELTNHPYLKHLASFNLPTILSTGMAYLDEVKEAVEVLTTAGLDKSKISVLHCNTQYPTPMEDVNLRAMNTLKSELGVEIGYSDHTLGIEIPIAAVAMGAQIIEKHFTLDKTMSGPDHKASLNPKELQEMIKAIRNIEIALGSDEKKPSPSEVDNRKIARKSLHFSQDLNKGHVLVEEDLSIKRPGEGIEPKYCEQLIGKTLKCDVASDQIVEWEHLQ